MTRPTLSFDGCGINGPDEFRTRIATFTDWNDAAKIYGPLFAAAPETLKQRDELLAVLKALYQHCVMTHKHWGENCNQREADAAIAAGRAIIEEGK